MFSLLLAIIYIAFISLGLPDGLLGSAWPSIYQEMNIPVSFMGIISIIISMGTVFSSLKSDFLTKKFGVGPVTAVSVFLTAFAIIGFFFSHSFIMLCIFAVPYGLGAGSVDSALNNYVALHYKSRHMSWLHCMWGVGASLGPVIIGSAMKAGQPWNKGYLYVGLIQAVLTLIVFLSLPLWNKNKALPMSESGNENETEKSTENKAISLKKLLSFPGVKAAMLTFFCYCALEQTAGQWAASFLVLARNVSPETAARYASFFYIGITIGRAICGFATFRFSDTQMIRAGFAIIVAGIVLTFIPSQVFSLAGLITIGLGCAPTFPSMIHATPDHFGKEKSQAVIGVQMAAAYVGTTMAPPLFGLLTNLLNAKILPLYLTVILILMVIMHQILLKKTKK